MNNLKLSLGVALSLAFTVLVTFTSNAQSNRFEVIRSIEQLDQIYENLEKYYVDEIHPGTLSKIAIDAMLKELDPYTVYYHESNIEDYELMTTGQYGGIGALIRKHGDFVHVSEPYENNPAMSAGLRAGDVIISIDGVSMKEKTSEDVSNALKGPKGSPVSVEVDRPGNGKMTFSIVRDEIKLPDVPYSGMINEEVGYIKLNSFTRTASSDVKSAFQQLKSTGMSKLILDLRGNGGGLLIEAVRIVNMFIPKNEVVVTTLGRVNEENRTYKTMEDPLDLDIPIVVLMDESSASASEIVAGSLQDLDRAVVIGTRSYGKGLVQRTYDLEYGAKVKLTIAKYYTPSGRCVQRLEYYDRAEGEDVSEVPDSLIKVFKTRNGRDVIDGRGIEPDVLINLPDLSRLVIAMLENNIMFDFATEYAIKNTTIKPAAEFSLSDDEYSGFKAYVLSKEFTYSTISEDKVEKVKRTLEDEGFFDDVEEEYIALLSKVTPSKERDLEKFKDQIKNILQNEIVSRYYFQTGRAENSFREDDFINESVTLLQNLPKYNTILRK